MQNGNKIEELFKENEKLISFTIRKYFDSADIDKQELTDAGVDGLLQAILTFNENQNVKFSSYAIPCIKNNILKCFYRKGLIKNQMEKHTVSLNEPIMSGDLFDEGLTIENSIVMQDPHSFVDEYIAKEEVKDVLSNFKYLTPVQQICMLCFAEYAGTRDGQMQRACKALGFSTQNFNLSVNRAKKVLQLIYKPAQNCTVEELQEKARILKKQYPIVRTIEDFHKYKNSNNKNIKSAKEK